MQEALNEGDCRQPRLLPETTLDKKYEALYAVLMELPELMEGTKHTREHTRKSMPKCGVGSSFEFGRVIELEELLIHDFSTALVAS